MCRFSTFCPTCKGGKNPKVWVNSLLWQPCPSIGSPVWAKESRCLIAEQHPWGMHRWCSIIHLIEGYICTCLPSFWSSVARKQSSELLWQEGGTLIYCWARLAGNSLFTGSKEKAGKDVHLDYSRANLLKLEAIKLTSILFDHNLNSCENNLKYLLFQPEALIIRYFTKSKGIK